MSWYDTHGLRPCGCWKLGPRGQHYGHGTPGRKTSYRKGRWPWWSDLTAGQRRAKEKREAGLDDRGD